MSQKHDSKTYIEYALSNERIVVHFRWSYDPDIGHVTYSHLENEHLTKIHILRTEWARNTIQKPIPTNFNLPYPMNASSSTSESHVTVYVYDRSPLGMH